MNVRREAVNTGGAQHNWTLRRQASFDRALAGTEKQSGSLLTTVMQRRSIALGC